MEVRSGPDCHRAERLPDCFVRHVGAVVGASALGWGVSGGGTKVNEECMQLEAARMFAQLGYTVAGHRPGVQHEVGA